MEQPNTSGSSEELTADSDRGVREESRTGYDILFVGLVCFVVDRQSRIVLLPDGTEPPTGVTAHYPYVVVDPNDVADASRWQPANDDEAKLMELGLYRLPNCTLMLPGINDGGGVEGAQHDADVPKLKDADPTADIDPSAADAVVRMTLTSGKLEAFRTPNPPDPNSTDVAVISRLTLPYDGGIVVELDGTDRRLQLKPHTSVAIANVAFPGDDGSAHKEHFTIYGRLTKSKTIEDRPQKVSLAIPEFPARHYIFTLAIPVTDGTSRCGNQGCCQ